MPKDLPEDRKGSNSVWKRHGIKGVGSINIVSITPQVNSLMYTLGRRVVFRIGGSTSTKVGTPRSDKVVYV